MIRLAVILAFAAGAAHADEAPDGGAPGIADGGAGDAGAQVARARELYQSGMAAFAVDRFDGAIADFEAGFLLDPVPEFLFNIAQAHRKAGRREKAIEFYQRFIDLRPDVPDRASIEQTVAKLKAELQPLAVAALAKPPPLTPIYKRWWLWTAVGVAAAAIVAIGLGVGLSGGYPDTTFGFTKVGP